MDPRINIIEKRLKKVDRIIAVSGGKGGIGKSSVASVMALTLSDIGYEVGLLDLDFTGPSVHTILGKTETPKEDKGIVPPQIRGTKFMSIVFYTDGKPAPLRGRDVSNVLIELLAITQWGALDFLIIDMPPGMGDATLDVIRLINRAEFIVVTTQSKLSSETAERELKLLRELEVPVIGTVENMKESPEGKKGVLGEIRFDKDFEKSIGTDTLLETDFAEDVKKMVLGPKFKLGEDTAL